MKGAEAAERQTVQRLIFARMLVKTKRAWTREGVVKSVTEALSPPLSRPAAEKAVRDELSRCERSGWIGARTQRAGKRKSALRLALTPTAQVVTAALFGSPSLPQIRSWEHGQQLAALSQIGRAAVADKTLHVDRLAAVILAERTGAPAELDELRAVVDFLAWRALGVDTTAAFETDAVQRHLLRGTVPEGVRVNQTTWRRMLAMRVSGAASPDAKGLVRALLAQKSKARGKAVRSKPARRSQRERPAPATRAAAASVANDNSPRPRAQPTLADFAAAVHEGARMPGVARFHDDRAYIGSVWEQMRSRGLLGSMSLDEFKARLVAAHRDGLLRISRADLVAAMDPNELERSEARYQNATFHFVALEAGGTR